MLLSTFLAASAFSQKINYPPIVENNLILQGDKCNWDANAVHTFSVVEANKDGYKYWAYYGLDHYNVEDSHIKKCGLARSNNLEDWVKYEHNPIINNNCRWPTMVYSDGVFYMFYAEYNQDGDSRIVMTSGENGIDFGEKTVVVPYEKGEQNQNPFIYFNDKDSNYYLFYYNGTERAETGKLWNITVKKSSSVQGIKDAKPKLVLSSDKTLAAPSIAFYNNRYYLLVEEFSNFEKKDRWVTNAFWSDKIDEGYVRVGNNPVLANNDACAFQYLFDGKLYVFYSHSINLAESIWNLKMIKLK